MLSPELPISLPLSAPTSVLHAISTPISPVFASVFFSFPSTSILPMDGFQENNMQNPPPKKAPKSSMLATQILLRLLGAVASLSAALVMFTNKQTVFLYNTEVEALYSYSSAFTFFATANVVACVFFVVSSFAAGILARNRSGPNQYFFMFLHDLVMTTLLMAACAAAAAIGFVGKFGNEHVGWMAICDDFSRFCGRIVISLGLSYLALVVYLLLTVTSANNSREIKF